MRFLADMCVDYRVVSWLNAHDHEATHLRDEGLHRLPNGEIFAKAVAEDRVVLTFDLDFGEIAASAGNLRIGVVVFRLRNTRVDNVIARLSSVLAHCAKPLERGAIVIVEDNRHRVRPLPIGSGEPTAPDE